MNCDELLYAYMYGGEKGLESVIEAYGSGILRYCHSILCDYHEAQDVQQLTFIKAYQKRDTFGKDGDMNLKAFLYKIAYNNCIDIIRRRKKAVLFSFGKNKDRDYDYIPEVIQNALLSLSDIDRAIVYSHAVDEITFAELAEIYNKTPATLRKRYERARKKLAKLLSGEYPQYCNINIKEEV